jgi:hypothetical protein
MKRKADIELLSLTRADFHLRMTAETAATSIPQLAA